ncbi:MAG: HDIG domain-containing protein [Candidatus Omnitrophica bacterium]|nr:HDIG domain-containing protein [Candidatus Omnitrophota bacterium]
MRDSTLRDPLLTSPSRRVRDGSFWVSRILLFTGASALSAFVLFSEFEPGIGKQPFTVGEPAARTFFSPMTIRYVHEAKTDELRRKLALQVPPVYAIQHEPEKRAAAKLDQLGEALGALASPAPGGKQPEFPFEISEAAVKVMLAESSPSEIKRIIVAVLSQVFSAGVLEDADKKRLEEEGRDRIQTLRPESSEEKILFLRNVLSRREAAAALPDLLPESAGKKRAFRAALIEAAAALIDVNLKPDEEQTRERRGAAASSAQPVEETIKRDELVIQRGMLVTAEVQSVISQIQKKNAQREIVKKFSAGALMFFMVHAFLLFYLAIFEKKVLRSFRMCLLVVTVFAVTLILCKLIRVWPGSSAFFMPAALAPLLLVLLVSPRLGAAATLAMTVLAAPLADFAPDLMLAFFFAGMAGTFAALKVRKRVEFLRIGAAVGFVQAMVIFAYQLYQDQTAPGALEAASLGLVNGFMITMPCLFLLIAVFEALFDLATDITLLELSDLNHPLLKRMVIEAPGTYHHSLVVSRLAEGACEAIRANPLLARVGCYFHDIGKIAKSEFFTENQSSKPMSRHENLTPAESSRIIIDHVTEGIELGRRFKLKESVLRFIPEHQGTGVVYFFYRRALDQAAPGESVNPDDFRYPGPRPQSKETAAALLADSVEAASRSLREPTGESIRNLVRKIINDKFIDGQLDECDLTLRDLYKIQESFVHNLMAIFHTRVPYPEKTENADKPDLFKRGQFHKFR